MLIDGLGLELLADAATDAPFLAGLLDGTGLQAGCPTTTATSMGSLGTGLSPGTHGLLGYEVLDPDRGVLLNELKWDPGTDPVRWQPHPTLFGTLEAAGVGVTRIGNPEFRDSGLTVAAHRGGDFIGAKRLHTRAEAAVEVLSRPGPGLAYLYWGEVDAAGHAHGWRSPEWRRALRHVDHELARLARRLPDRHLLVITADHGMVDVPHRDRVDLADHPELTGPDAGAGRRTAVRPGLLRAGRRPGRRRADGRRLRRPGLGARAGRPRDRRPAGSARSPTATSARIGDVLVPRPRRRSPWSTPGPRPRRCSG